MIESMKRMIVGLVMMVDFLQSSYATREANNAHREDVFKGFSHHSTTKNDFLRELLEDGTHTWIATMSFYTGSPDTASPSGFPHAKQKHPTLSPSTKSIPIASTSPINSLQGEFTLEPSFPQKTIQPALAPFSYYKPVNAKSQSALPTSHPSNIDFREPSTTLTPQSDSHGENMRTQTPIPMVDKTSIQPSDRSINPPSTLQQLDVFHCDFNNVITAVQFKVGYEIESTANQAEYIESVERLIMITALAGALQCETGGVFFSNLTAGATGRSKENFEIPFNTASTNDTCEASISSCKIFETQFQVSLNKIVDPEIAAFLGYVMLKENMEDGTFAQNIPTIDRCEYLKPLPLRPPMTQTNGTSQEENQSTDRLSVSPWSLAAVSAMCK
jgi:hypothetical protein